MSFLSDKKKAKKAKFSDQFVEISKTEEHAEENFDLEKSSRLFLRELEIKGKLSQEQKGGMAHAIPSNDFVIKPETTTIPVNANEESALKAVGFKQLAWAYIDGRQYFTIPEGMIKQGIDFHMYIKYESFNEVGGWRHLALSEGPNSTFPFEARVGNEDQGSIRGQMFGFPDKSLADTDTQGIFTIGPVTKGKLIGCGGNNSLLTDFEITDEGDGIYTISGKISGTQYSTTFTENYNPIHFFATHLGGSRFIGRCAYILIYGGEEKLAELVPAKRDRDGVVGFLDLLTDNFYVSRGTAPFYSRYDKLNYNSEIERGGYIEEDRIVNKLTLVSAKRGLPKGYKEITELRSPAVPYPGNYTVTYRNLLDPSTITENYYYWAAGASYNEAYSYTGLIPVSAGQKIYFQTGGSRAADRHNRGMRFVVAYDENKQRVSSASSDQEGYPYVVPNGISYIRVTGSKTWLKSSNKPVILASETGDIVDYLSYFTHNPDSFGRYASLDIENSYDFIYDVDAEPQQRTGKKALAPLLTGNIDLYGCEFSSVQNKGLLGQYAICGGKSYIAEDSLEVDEYKRLALSHIGRPLVHKNLLDPSAITENYYYWTTGAVYNEAYSYTGLIPVSAGQKIYFQTGPGGHTDAAHRANQNMRFVVAYNENKQIISSASSSQERYPYVVPNGVSYIRITALKSYLASGVKPAIFASYTGEPEDYNGYTPSGIGLTRRLIFSFDDNDRSRMHMTALCKGTVNGEEVERRFGFDLFSTGSGQRIEDGLRFGVWEKENTSYNGVTGFIFRRILIKDKSGVPVYDIRACKKEDTGEFGLYIIGADNSETFCPFTLQDHRNRTIMEELGAESEGIDAVMDYVPFPDEEGDQQYLDGESTVLRDINRTNIYLPEELASLGGWVGTPTIYDVLSISNKNGEKCGELTCQVATKKLTAGNYIAAISGNLEAYGVEYPIIFADNLDWNDLTREDTIFDSSLSELLIKRIPGQTGNISEQLPELPLKENYSLVIPRPSAVGGKSNIARRAFWRWDKLKSVYMPSDYTKTGIYLFWGDTGLEYAVISNNLSYLAAGLFDACENLKNVYPTNFYGKVLSQVDAVVPNSVKRIDGAAFEGTSLKSICVGSGCESIDAAAFSSDTLKTLWLPDNISYFHERSFWGVDEYNFKIYCNKDSLTYRNIIDGIDENKFHIRTHTLLTRANILTEEDGGGYINYNIPDTFNIFYAQYQYFWSGGGQVLPIKSDTFCEVPATQKITSVHVVRGYMSFNFTGPWQCTCQSYYNSWSPERGGFGGRMPRIWFTLPKEYDTVEKAREYFALHPKAFYVRVQGATIVPVDMTKVKIGDGERELFLENSFGTLSGDNVNSYGSTISEFTLGSVSSPSSMKIQYYSNKSK